MFVRWWFPVPVLHTHNDDFLCQVSVCMITISCACVDCCVVGFQCTTSQNWCITVLTCCRMTRCACTSNSCPRLVSPGGFLKVLINPGKVSLAASLWDGLVGYFLLVLPSLCVCVCWTLPTMRNSALLPFTQQWSLYHFSLLQTSRGDELCRENHWYFEKNKNMHTY